MKIEGAFHPVISVCPFKSIVTQSFLQPNEVGFAPEVCCIFKANHSDEWTLTDATGTGWSLYILVIDTRLLMMVNYNLRCHRDHPARDYIL